MDKDIEQLKAENAILKHVLELKNGTIPKLIAENKRLKSCLQEIKEIAEEIADTGNWLNCGYNASRAKQIAVLNLINNIWEHLSPQEKGEISNILQEYSDD